jgi:hypothetical protein
MIFALQTRKSFVNVIQYGDGDVTCTPPGVEEINVNNIPCIRATKHVKGNLSRKTCSSVRSSTEWVVPNIERNGPFIK